MQSIVIGHNSEQNLRYNLNLNDHAEHLYTTYHGTVTSYTRIAVHGGAEGWYVSLRSYVPGQGMTNGATVASARDAWTAIDRAVAYVKQFYPLFFVAPAERN